MEWSYSRCGKMSSHSVLEVHNLGENSKLSIKRMILSLPYDYLFTIIIQGDTCETERFRINTTQLLFNVNQYI